MKRKLTNSLNISLGGERTLVLHGGNEVEEHHEYGGKVWITWLGCDAEPAGGAWIRREELEAAC